MRIVYKEFVYSIKHLKHVSGCIDQWFFCLSLITLCTSPLAEAIAADYIICGSDPFGFASPFLALK